jgi:hypothetical protein
MARVVIGVDPHRPAPCWPPSVPRDVVGKTRRWLASELIHELVVIDKKTKIAKQELTELVTSTGSRLMDLHGSLRHQSARRGAASPLCRASSASYSEVRTQARKSSRSVMPSACPPAQRITQSDTELCAARPETSSINTLCVVMDGRDALLMRLSGSVSQRIFDPAADGEGGEHDCAVCSIDSRWWW